MDGRCRATTSAQWGFPLASVPTGSNRLGFVGSPVVRQSLDCVLQQLPSIYVALREGGPTAIHGKRPRSGRELDWFLNSGDLFKRKGDHIPNILPLDLHISS
jgi:hypothetical protein